MAQVPQESAQLRPEDGSPDGRQGAVRPARQHLRGDRLQDALEPAEVRLEPLVPAHYPRPRAIWTGGKAGEHLHEAFGLRHDLGEVL